MMPSKLLILFLSLILLACASTNLPPIGAEASLQLQDDEKRLWNRSEEEEQRLNGSNLLYEDANLIAYVNEVARKLTPEEVKANGFSFQIKIIKNPLLNAFTYPNGVIYVHTGILAKMDNEAQLATLLGHEMTHATHRHAVKGFRNVKNATATLSAFQTVVIPFGILGALPSLLGVVGAMASVSGYSKDLEAEADREGLELMVRAGYDPEEAPKLFEHLKKDVEEQKEKEPFFFGTHPRLKERIANYTKILKRSYRGKQGIKGAEAFKGNIQTLILQNAMLDLSMGRFVSALQGLEKGLRIEPENAKAHYYLAEVYRQRNEKGDSETAEKEYKLAVQLLPSYPEPHKGLGLLYFKRDYLAEAQEEFEKYLSHASAPDDKKYIEEYLQEIRARLANHP